MELNSGVMHRSKLAPIVFLNPHLYRRLLLSFLNIQSANISGAGVSDPDIYLELDVLHLLLDNLR